MKKNKCPDCPTETGKHIDKTENLLLKNPGMENLEIYKLYVERIMKHYDLRLVHFKIYLGFNSGLILVAGYLLKLYLEKNNVVISVPWVFTVVIPFIGIFFSIAWFLVGKNDRKVQLDMNQIIKNVEEKIFNDNKKLGLYTKINEEYRPTKPWGFDIIDINVYMALFFILIWIAFVFFACHYISTSPVTICLSPSYFI